MKPGDRGGETVCGENGCHGGGCVWCGPVEVHYPDCPYEGDDTYDDDSDYTTSQYQAWDSDDRVGAP